MEKLIDNAFWRFAACMAGTPLLSIYPRTARRAPVSKIGFQFLLSAGGIFRGRPQPSPKRTFKYLMRCEIFRGKVPPRQTQTKTVLENSAAIAPTKL
ncbi:MAG TPA: hypothetical protein VF988_05850 [Verrucomicrobiae bacterium]